MKKHFDNCRQTRKNILDFLKGIDEKHLTRIPDGFNNNILWNFGHIFVAQQVLLYKLSSVEPVISDKLIQNFGKGTKPDPEQIYLLPEIMDDFIGVIDKAEVDYENGVFSGFNKYTTSYGITLSSPDDAITFINIHDAVHFGYMKAQARVL